MRKAKEGNQEPASRKGPSLAALAALTTLAVGLWFDVELSAALFRSVLVYLGLSLLTTVYRVILGHYLRTSQERAQREFLEKVQREAESERTRPPKAEHDTPGKTTAPKAQSAPAGESLRTKPASPPAAEPVAARSATVDGGE